MHARSMSRWLSLPLALALCGVAGCASDASKRLESMYRSSIDQDGRASAPGELQAIEETRREWIAKVLEYHAAGEIQSDQDRLYAASLLLDSNSEVELELARDLALEAAEHGDERGFPLAAEAVDRVLMLQGLPQRYGTQYVFVPGQGWVLYRWNYSTTDAERAAMGLPPLAEAIRRLELLNAAP